MPEFETIGKYEVLETIGEGGFGIVYKARDPLMERLVAIKVCSTEDDHIRKRFLREAKIAGGLDHTNIVTAFEYGTEKDLPYLVQELLTGEDLRVKIDRKDPIEPRLKLDYLAQIAKGLEHAHSHGVLHRDIKPANVRVLDDGRVKLMDFGMAKIAKESATRLTQTGSVMGTAGYFAPEQLMALELDHRVDIFSYGVLAYELLTYEKAFPGDSFMVVFRQVLHDEPESILKTWSECPADLTALVEKCLKKERDDRFDSFSKVLPILYLILNSSSFDQRSAPRGAPEPEALGATVLTPIGELLPLPKTKSLAQETPKVDNEDPSPVDAGPPESTSESKQSEEPHVSKSESNTGASSRPPESPRQAIGPSRRLHAPSLFSAAAKVKPGPMVWVLAGGALLLLVGLGIWLLSRRDEQPTVTPDSDTIVEVEQPNEQLIDPKIPTYSLIVEASPWGEVVELSAGSGETLPLPVSPFTPLQLNLPEGSYSIRVQDPNSASIQSCQVNIGNSSDHTCLIKFPTPNAIDYFKEAGWWD